MSSITFWNRLEPRPRSSDIARALEAQVRDPAWLLARQWQFGEFHGEDAASPAFVRVTRTTAPVVGWRVPGRPTAAIPNQPIEETVETEAFTADLSLRVELGQTLERLLRDAGASAAAIQAVRARYPFTGTSTADDPEADRFARVCAARALDGFLVYQSLLAAAPAYPEPVSSLDGADQIATRTALDRFKIWIEDLYGSIGVGDAQAWRADRFEYGVEVVVTRPDGSVGVLDATPDRDATFDWFAFDERPSKGDALAAAPVATVRTSVLPIHVRFRGMPNHRFWDFESGQVNFGGLEVDTRDLARLVVSDFLLVQGNDWFLMPIDQPVGTLSRIDALIVHDVFGGRTLIERADAGIAPASGEDRWTMFSTERGAGLADYLIVPPSAVTSVQSGKPLETVHMFRDPMANMAWAVEHETENALGVAWSGHEREISKQPEPVPPENGPTTEPPLRWRIQTPVPAHWIPLVPVATDPLSGMIALLPGAMLRIGSGGVAEPASPAGRILKPGVPIAEAEVPRVGTRVTRVVCRTRWSDGSTYLWIARRKTAGAGEGGSGLKFDVAELRKVPT